MPSYLSSIYSSQPNILSNYGIIVGVVGSVAVLGGGTISAYYSKRAIAVVPLCLTGIGGMISAPFVILMVFSLDLANGNQDQGARILYGVMSAAYMTAELWLGAFASLLALLLPPRTKTFGFAIYSCVVTLVYSSGPQIIGLALRSYAVQSEEYLQKSKIVLAVLIPIAYWFGGVGFLWATEKIRRDIGNEPSALERKMSFGRKFTFGVFAATLLAMVITLFTLSVVYR